MKLALSELKKKPAVFSIVLLVLVSIPLTVFLAITQQIFINRAAQQSVSVSLVSPKQNFALDEEFTVDLVITSENYPVVGMSLDLTGIEPFFTVKDIQPQAPFVSIDPTKKTIPVIFIADGYRLSGVGDLPIGTFTMAKIVLQTKQLGGGELTLNRGTSWVSGLTVENEKSFTVSLNIVPPDPIAFEIGDLPDTALCQIHWCTNPDTIELAHTLRADNRFDVTVSWQTPLPPTATQSAVFKVYRNIGGPVPLPHSISRLVRRIAGLQFTDTNVGAGFEGESTIYYDIDTYLPCESL